MSDLGKYREGALAVGKHRRRTSVAMGLFIGWAVILAAGMAYGCYLAMVTLSHGPP